MHQIYNHVQMHAIKGDVESIIKTVDEYCIEFPNHALHIGKEKGIIFDSVVKECQPTLTLEFGVYFGYTALRTARLLKQDGMVFAVEWDPEMIKISSAMIEYAGMKDRIKLVAGKSSDIIAYFHDDVFPTSSFDFVFLDHDKKLYKQDLILMEEHNLLKKGTCILADNVIYPGAPDYIEYVRSSSKYKSIAFPCKGKHNKGMEYDDEMEKSIYLVD